MVHSNGSCCWFFILEPFCSPVTGRTWSDAKHRSTVKHQQFQFQCFKSWIPGHHVLVHCRKPLISVSPKDGWVPPVCQSLLCGLVEFRSPMHRALTSKRRRGGGVETCQSTDYGSGLWFQICFPLEWILELVELVFFWDLVRPPSKEVMTSCVSLRCDESLIQQLEDWASAGVSEGLFMQDIFNLLTLALWPAQLVRGAVNSLASLVVFSSFCRQGPEQIDLTIIDQGAHVTSGDRQQQTSGP